MYGALLTSRVSEQITYYLLTLVDILTTQVYVLGCMVKRLDRAIEEEMLRMHDAGMSPTEIARHMGTYNTSVRRVLLRYGRRLKDQSEAQLSVSINPFTDLSSDACQYWLGYICADGNVSNGSRNRINVSTNLDPVHLESYCEFVGQGVEVKSYFNKRYQVWEYSVNFSSREVKEYLLSLGITPAKSKTLELSIPITAAMVRGVMDGDGCVHHKTDTNVYVSISSASSAFSIQIAQFLRDSDIEISERPSNGMYHVEIFGFDNVAEYYRLIYTDATYFLMRKRLKFGSLIAKDMSEHLPNSVEGWHPPIPS